MECCAAGLPERRTNCRSERRSVEGRTLCRRLKVPAGYKVPAHVHPNDEHVTVISGTFNIGMGDKLDEKKGNALKAGGFARAPKDMQHYAWFNEDTIVQLHGMGRRGLPTLIRPMIRAKAIRT